MPHKYRARRTVIDGIAFDSQKEANRYAELKLMERENLITGLTLQPSFELQEGFKASNGKRYRKIVYIADFSYFEDGKHVVEDTKGFKTQVFRLKEKLFRFRYPEIDLRLT